MIESTKQPTHKKTNENKNISKCHAKWMTNNINTNKKRTHNTKHIFQTEM